ncbi:MULTISPECIES: HAD family phosphatase [unclassified Enterococcus]|uniref:HAD family hydrolase n=1 Tax=unclassified Enterococcus TaxID=2608891 RepID=UPI001557ECCA|nr:MULTISPECIES: HAD family phosphatase [unclassified Enterococcus]MBS7577428.1 HAD family phosphatase [Enterococcus sp. MMGLQ5-2]MBS7584835.1 HAD family phosphatase [Enterococcus sp. MMGLQ5-1]NPD12690.1 HAD family phosphatase [Enterococcus sp. MMGLQ5-1]NPD37262.1 HAD family phosphatase [Enterococcus sp. MMGLQ5-2]
MLKAIIFDMDGVLVDSEYTFLESKTQILKEAGFPMPISYQYQFMGTTFEFMWQQMKQELGLPLPVQSYIDKMELLRKKMIARDGIKAIKNSPALVKRLAKSDIKLAVASSSPRNEIEAVLKALNLQQYFSAIVSAEEVEHSKPAPDVFLRAAEKLAVQPNACLAFEDTKNGSLSASQAAMYVIGFENPDYPAQDLSAANFIVREYDGLTIERLNALFNQH